MNEAQHRVLKMLEAGTINAEEANRLLAALSGRRVAPPAGVPVPEPEALVEAAPAVETASTAVDAVPAPVEPESPDRPPVASLADVAALAAASSEEVLRQVAREETADDRAQDSLSNSGEAAPELDETPSSPAPDASGARWFKRRWRLWG